MSQRLARSAGLIGAATMLSRVFGLARDVFYAWLFGAGDRMDAFNVAFRIPNLVRDLFAEGAMTAAFVPTFTRYLTQRGRDEPWRLGSQVINALLLATSLVVLAGMVFAGPMLLDEEADMLAELEAFLGVQIKFRAEAQYNQEQYDVVLL